MIILTWIARVWAVMFVATWAVIGVICGAQAVRDWWRQAGRDMDEAIASVCKPCNGESGRCTCSRKCGHWLCGAADTGVMTIDDEYRALLDKEAGR